MTGRIDTVLAYQSFNRPSGKHPRQPFDSALLYIDRHAFAIHFLVHVLPRMANDILFRLLVDLPVALEAVDDVVPKRVESLVLGLFSELIDHDLPPHVIDLVAERIGIVGRGQVREKVLILSPDDLIPMLDQSQFKQMAVDWNQPW